jgi:hypothetical protein
MIASRCSGVSSRPLLAASARCTKSAFSWEVGVCVVSRCGVCEPLWWCTMVMVIHPRTRTHLGDARGRGGGLGCPKKVEGHGTGRRPQAEDETHDQQRQMTPTAAADGHGVCSDLVLCGVRVCGKDAVRSISISDRGPTRAGVLMTMMWWCLRVQTCCRNPRDFSLKKKKQAQSRTDLL